MTPIIKGMLVVSLQIMNIDHFVHSGVLYVHTSDLSTDVLKQVNLLIMSRLRFLHKP